MAQLPEFPKYPLGQDGRNSIVRHLRKGGMTWRERFKQQQDHLVYALHQAGGLPRLSALAHLSTILDELLLEEVAERRELGESWAAVGADLGMTRQAAQQRFGPLL